MTQRVSVQQASLNALAAYLATQFTDAVVMGRWPDTTVLPAKAITIVQTGNPDILMSAPNPTFSSAVDAKNNNYRWITNDIVIPIQLDVWATSSPARDDIVARLDDIMNRGKSIVNPNADPNGEGTALPIGDGWTGTIDCLLDGANVADEADAIKRSEYRTSYSGTIAATRYNVRESPILKTVTLTETLDGTPR